MVVLIQLLYLDSSAMYRRLDRGISFAVNVSTLVMLIFVIVEIDYNAIVSETNPPKIDIHKTLLDVFGYHSFRGDQERVIKHIVAGNHAVVIMPTGAGKSICYQIPAIASGGLTVVISPLIALMKDQVEALRANGVAAAAINSSISQEAQREAIDDLRQGRLRLLYLSPERAVTDRFLRFIADCNVDYIAIDEAHCVSIWGNDFRPEYTALSKLIEVLPRATVIALTATADAATRADIQQRLGISDAEVFVSSFERSNINVEVRPAMQRIEAIRRFLMQQGDAAGIVYCLSRKSTESVAKKLQEIGIKAEAYHARLDPAVKNKVQEQFQNDEVQVVCATIAFGMGIDKSNIRYVIHYNMPKNIEAYYQEIGRAGRDGKPARAVMYAGYGDVALYRSMIADSNAPASFTDVQTQKLDRMWEYAQATSCRTNVVLSYFGEIKNEPCGYCDNCKNPPASIDGTLHAQKAISAVIRCKETVGVQLLTDILRGSFRAEVRAGGYEHIKTFGAGRELPRGHWVQYITQLINHGALAIDYTDRSTLKVTTLGMSIIKGEQTIRLTEPRDYTKTAKRDINVRKVSKRELFQNGLEEHLKLWRKQKAKDLGIAAPNILGDKTVLDLSIAAPLWMDELPAIDGLSGAKQRDYGADLLDSIRTYVLRQKHTKTVKGKTLLDTLNLYTEGDDIDTMVNKRKVKKGTIFKQLGQLMIHGEKIDILRYVEQAHIDEVATIAHKYQLRVPEEIAGHTTHVIGLHEIGLIMTYLRVDGTL